MSKLAGKVALVTGGSSGIGLAGRAGICIRRVQRFSSLDAAESNLMRP
jgi:NAD(P)-dependent dehydrogenase (short-subunit alcohol dehydrogenase family)